jgi:hypothetical protein
MHPTNQLHVLSVGVKLATSSLDCCIGPLEASSLEGLYFFSLKNGTNKVKLSLANGRGE